MNIMRLFNIGLCVALLACMAVALTGCQVNVVVAPHAAVEVLKDANKTLPTIVTAEHLE